MNPCPGHADGRRPTPTFPWVQTRGGPVCADCDIPWPGHLLPEPAHQVEGYGHVAQQAGWGERVRSMVPTGHELDEIEA